MWAILQIDNSFLFAGHFSALAILSITFESFLPPLDRDTVIRQPQNHHYHSHRSDDTPKDPEFF
jgi:hypothetical protein